MGWPEIIDAIRDAIVRVTSAGLTGTAFHVEGGIFVSANHVIRSPAHVELELASDTKVGADVATNPSLASVDLVTLTPRSQQSLPMLALGGVADARVGDEVLFGGFPFDSEMPLTFHKAMIAFVGRRAFPPIINSQVDCLQLDGSVNLGNSGGPVVNQKGAVIGVISARYGKLTNFLDDFLKEQKESREALARMGIGGGPQMGTAKIGGKTYKRFDAGDAQKAFIDIVSMLQRDTNVGIGWAVSSEYIRRHALP